MSDPALQQLIFQAESTYRPQYTALNQRDLQNTLLGVNPGQEGGFYGTLDLADMAARRQATLGQSLQTQATEFGLGQLGTYAPQARDAYLAANPQMAAALGQAESMGGRQVSGYLNEMGRLAMQAPQSQAINPFAGQARPIYGDAQQQAQSALEVARQGAMDGGQTAMAGQGVSPELRARMDSIVSSSRAADAGGMPQVSMPGAVRADQVMADRVTSGGILTPERVAADQVQAERIAAERIAAERVAAGQVQAGQVGQGTLGESLYQQALNAQQQSPLSQALQSQGLARATAPGQLSPEEIRAATQGSREGYAASGRLMDNASITGEALARAGAARERSTQDLALAQQINQQLLGAQQAGQALATDVLRTDIQRQQANVGTQLQAGTFNVDTQLRAGLANQQAMLDAARANQSTGLAASQSNQDAFLRAGMANQSANLQASLANQAAFMDAGRFNITNAQDVQRLNQAANLQANLANQGVNLQANLANQANQQRGYEFVTGTNLQAQLANRDFAAQQQQQRFANLGAVLGSEQSMLGADRAYALQQAGQQQGVTAASLGLIGFGQTPQALQYGAQQQGISASQMGMGPQLFDPSAGINLGLMNAANLGNYQAATYGARAGAQGAMMGGLMQGLGTIGGAAIGKYCWVAREVYGEENPKWLLFREWLLSKAPAWFRNLYIKYGERFAKFISNKPKLKSLIRRWMDSRISYNFA
jgi:hypothetical protein